MREVAKNANVPVLNMQCDIDHPFQTLADLMTIREEFGKNLKGLKIAVSWAYAPSYAKPMSVPQGLITLMPRFGLDVVLAHPPEYSLMKSEVEYARKAAKENGTNFEIVDNMDDATMAEAVRRARGRVLLEASGNMTIERLPRVAATGVDFVSMGAITHSARAVDISFELG